MASIEPVNFFDDHPLFIETSETGHWLSRLNARYTALIHQNRHLFDGARVLDLAAHDGRFAFAALQHGAEHVVGIDVKGHLMETGRQHMETYGVSPDRYSYLVGDMYDCLDIHGPFDVVLIFGIFYHINDHMGLLTRVAEVNPAHLILDTHTSQMDGAIIEVRSPLGASPPEPGNDLEGYPTVGALDAMFSSFGWSTDYFDWNASGLCATDHMSDYRSGKRVSAVVTCPEHDIAPDVRAEAVAEVLASDADRESIFIVMTLVAERHGFSPQALRTWVRQAQRQRSRDSGFTL